MKAVQIVKPNQLEVIDIEKPVIDPKNNVLVKMTAAGICGSDVGIYHGTNAAATYPRIIGHEMVGVVAEVDGFSIAVFANFLGTILNITLDHKSFYQIMNLF